MKLTLKFIASLLTPGIMKKAILAYECAQKKNTKIKNIIIYDNKWTFVSSIMSNFEKNHLQLYNVF